MPFKSKEAIRTEFNMAQLDLERIDAVCKKCDEYGFAVVAGDYRWMNQYFSSLYSLFRILQSFMNNRNREWYRGQINAAAKLKVEIEKKHHVRDPSKTGELINKLNEIQELLYRFKQYVNLGVPTYRKKSANKMLEEVLVGSK